MTVIRHKIVYLSIAAIGVYNEASLYPPDPCLLGENFDFMRGFY